ncbi:MAG: phospholipid carrier-dependent glycosyltransferase [Patescibacteria group bacterium]
MSTFWPRSVWIPVLALALVIFGWRLNSVPLTNWDEGIYANVNLELFRSHDWTKLTYFGKDFLEKPPLQFWLTYPLIGVFGPTELAMRLWSALAGAGTAVLLALWGWQATQKRSVAWLAGGLFVLGRFALIHAFRSGDLDGLLTFLIVLAMYGYWRSLATPRWIIVWGAAGAAAVMTKSLVGLLPLIIVGIDILVSRGWRRIGWGNIAWAAAAFVALAAPWHIIETVRFGRSFWDSYLGLSVIERTTESLFTATPWHWYLGIIRDRFWPFSFFLPLAMVLAGRRAGPEKNGLDRLLLLWFAVTLIIFSLIQTRREWYILPLYPAAAMLLARGAAAWWSERQPRWMQALGLVSIAAMFGHLLTDTTVRNVLAHIPVGRGLRRVFWQTIPGQILFGVAATVATAIAAALLARRRCSRRQWILGLSGGVMGIVALTWTGRYIRALPAALPLKTIANRVAQEKANELSLIGTKLKKQPAGYFYILRLDTHSAEYASGTPPPTPLVLTTTEEKNAPLNTAGKRLVKLPPFILLDLR